jgi:hypothetical protein
MAITQEDCISAHRAEKKRKTPTGLSTAQPPRYRLVQSTATRAPPRNNIPGRWVARPPQQARFNRPPTPQPRNNSSKAHDRAFRHPTKETTTIVVSIAAARPISLRIAPNPKDLFKGRHPTRTTRARARSRWYKLARGG